MSAYVIFNYRITDREQIDELSRRAAEIDRKHAARVIVGSPLRTVEGEAPSHIVIYEFATFAAAQAWYQAPEQQELALFRRAITEGWVSIVPGVDETEAVVESGYFQCAEAAEA